MISVANVSGRATWRAPAWMRPSIGPFARGPRKWKMLSITITVESATMPKSTAPIEIRFAGVPVATMPQNAASSASGMFSAVISAARQLPRNKRRMMVTSPMPTSTFSSTVCVVSATRLPRS